MGRVRDNRRMPELLEQSRIADAPRRLPRGPHSLTREQVATNQRRRLLEGMIDAIGEKGYAAITVSDVIKRAGVSRKAFYEHFANKEECFLATYDSIAAIGRRGVSAGVPPRRGPARQRAGGARGAVRAGDRAPGGAAGADGRDRRGRPGGDRAPRTAGRALRGLPAREPRPAARAQARSPTRCCAAWWGASCT